MKPSSCASRSERLLIGACLLALAGCAPAPMRAAPAAATAPEPPAPGTLVTLEFANATAKASMQIDLASTDVQLDMRTSPRKDSVLRRGDNTALRASSLPGATPSTAATAAPLPSPTDSVTRAVVAGIRQAQGHLLRGDLAQARSAVETSLALRPTPEAHALAGSVAWVGGDRDRARAQWKAALALDPAHPGVAEALSRSETPPMPDAGKGPSR
jgi:Flp pilus assembly protein TadD